MKQKKKNTRETREIDDLDKALRLISDISLFLQNPPKSKEEIEKYLENLFFYGSRLMKTKKRLEHIKPVNSKHEEDLINTSKYCEASVNSIIEIISKYQMRKGE